MKLTPKTILKATAACILLTLIWYFFRNHQVGSDYFAEFELIAAWAIVVAGWIVCLVSLLCSRKKRE